MSTTLTNGLKLPDKGSVDWYADMQNNYTILDGAVGTVAEHTTALAGKAPLVHTHTKSDITDFPVYGTTAGTICEGNDSRLSDARTPVAHTHTKSDVTDLFNSANTWASLNTYNGMVLLKSSSDVAEQFKQKLPKDVSVSTDALVRFNTLTDSEDHNVIVEALGHWANYVSKSVTLKYKNDSTKQGVIDFRLGSSGSGLFYPQSPFECNLGNSRNQWKSVYAQSYYYNGVAWGLDQNNTWTGANSFYKSIQIHGGRNAYIMPEFGASYSGLAFGTVEFKQSFKFGDWVDNNSTIGLNTSNAYVEIYAGLDSSDSVNKARLNPVNTTVAELGTSTNKWKTLNGINPGALSLPNINYTEGNPDVYNVGTDINNLTKNVSDPLHFSWTSPFDGWLAITWYLRNLNPPFNVLIQSDSNAIYSKFSQTWSASSARWYLATTFPVVKNVTYYFDLDFQNTSIGVVHHAYLLPCLGNV